MKALIVREEVESLIHVGIGHLSALEYLERILLLTGFSKENIVNVSISDLGRFLFVSNDDCLLLSTSFVFDISEIEKIVQKKDRSSVLVQKNRRLIKAKDNNFRKWDFLGAIFLVYRDIEKITKYYFSSLEEIFYLTYDFIDFIDNNSEEDNVHSKDLKLQTQATLDLTGGSFANLRKETLIRKYADSNVVGGGEW